ncbi:MAG: tRNA uridine-5-carboxymethylaminomethyl(34) synthesis GTPase MnmE [Oligoflexales bacterium]|nr:tRNA uridine-5-carboxymethylaminomethyl(34) synthesis GTPase MnmE [Oligoflexales bacterium]
MEDFGDVKDPASAGFSFNEEPIAAVASAQGRGAVTIIRLSGTGCHELCKNILIPAKNKNEIKFRHMGLFRLSDPSSGECLDELLAVFFKGPSSFTGQDSVEIYCHGSPYIVSRILKVLFSSGFRPAEPGEFTKRAFLNGKMDLAQAEGIRELVEASTHQQWMAARQLATGKLSRFIEELREKIIESMAYLEAAIDFPEEEDVLRMNLDQVLKRVQDVRSKIFQLISTYKNGKVASQGLTVCISGAPNAGKSTLMNLLLGRERAIVTHVAGTTRDYLEEACLMDGRLVRLIDTAGIRDTTELVERLGIEASLKKAGEADVVLALVSADESRASLDMIKSRLAEIGAAEVIYVITKTDLARPAWGEGILGISSHTGEGVLELKDKLVRMVDGYVGSLGESTFVTSSRHLVSLERALDFIDRFFNACRNDEGEECLAFELQHAARAISTIIGEVDNEEILDKIFETFCIGK